MLIKNPKNATFAAGDTLTFEILVRNSGDFPATGVTPNDPLPTTGGLTWAVDSVNPAKPCSINAAQILSCTLGDPAPGDVVTIVLHSTNAGGAPIAACTGERIDNVARGTSTNAGTLQDTGDYTCPLPIPPPLLQQGCTPGYWKQRHHFDSWPAPYTPTTLFATVFEDAFPGKTLVDVLAQGGGGLTALGRHTVAALLNAASPSVNYAIATPGEVIAQFNAVFPGGGYQGLKNTFEDFNKRGCPLR